MGWTVVHWIPKRHKRVCRAFERRDQAYEYVTSKIDESGYRGDVCGPRECDEWQCEYMVYLLKEMMVEVLFIVQTARI